MALANGTSDGGQQPPAERMVTLRDYGAPSGLDALTGTRHVQTAGPLALDYQMALRSSAYRSQYTAIAVQVVA